MALLAPDDQAQLRAEFDHMTRPVHLLLFTQSLDCETCPQARQILDELPLVSDRIVVEEVNFVLEPDRARQYGVDRVPAVAIAYEGEGGLVDSRMRFLGAPSGYEFISIVQAVLLAGGRAPHLSEASRQRLAAVDRPVTMQVFTTPT
jgi:alkyl hydroperoxide reductase subunit AhpF